MVGRQLDVTEIRLRNQVSAAGVNLRQHIGIRDIAGSNTHLTRSRSAVEFQRQLSFLQFRQCVALPRRFHRSIRHQLQQLIKGTAGGGSLRPLCRHAHGIFGAEADCTDGTLYAIPVSITQIQVAHQRGSVCGVLVQLLEIHVDPGLVRHLCCRDGIQVLIQVIGVLYNGSAYVVHADFLVIDLIGVNLQLQRLAVVNRQLTAGVCQLDNNGSLNLVELLGTGAAFQLKRHAGQRSSHCLNGVCLA